MKWSTALLVALLLTLYSIALGRHGLLEPDEGRYGETAREMLESGDFLIPTLNGIPRVQKPPVIYWSTSACLKVFGENEIGARMPSLLAAMGVLLLTWWIGRKWFDPATGRMSFWFLAGGLQFFVLSRGLCPDVVMTFWSTAAIAAFVWASLHSAPTRLRFVPFFACMGIAFATKGPIGILVPLFTAIGWQLSARLKSMPRVRMPWLSGLVLTVCLALGWFAACSIRYPELAKYFLQYELLDRFFSHTHGRGQPFWFFIPVLLLGWLPWSPLFPLTLCSRTSEANDRSHIARHALLGWLVPAFLLLSFSGSKLVTYILPLFPGVALWLAHALAKRTRSRGLTLSAIAQTLILLSLGAGMAVVILRPELLPRPLETDRWFLPLWTVATALAVSAAWTIHRGITETRVVRLSLASILMWLLLMSQLVHFGPVLGRQASLKPLADRIRQEPGWEQAQIIVAGRRGHGIEFYLRRLVDTTRREADIVLQPPPEIEARLHESVSDLRISNVGGLPCYVIAQNGDLERGAFPETQWTLLQKEGVFVLLRSNK
ncbi:MAG: glycosyltransferase family 39 protein [Verrucomicrobia bacterium]|nr:glycosyltransferase family 39 protein [Verrucomicrobiota bacterium]